MQNNISRAEVYSLTFTDVNKNLSASCKEHFIPTLFHVYTRIHNTIFFFMNNRKKNPGKKEIFDNQKVA